MTESYNCRRVRRYLLRKKPQEFTAADIGKKLDMPSRAVAAYFKDIPEVAIAAKRKFAHRESGNRYLLVTERSV